MPSPSEAPPAAAIVAQPWGMRVGGAVLIAVLVIVAFALSDAAHRRDLEAVSETTAVGDTHLFNLPETATLPVAAATLDGKSLSVADANLLEFRDTHMSRAGSDPATGLTIYRLSPAATANERKHAGSTAAACFLKAAPNRYLAAESGK